VKKLIITYREISRVTFPVFRLRNYNWYKQDGLLILDDKILDDTNQPGDTLGARRLQTPHTNLYQMRSCVTDHLGLIKQSGRDKFFIDSKGLPFIYKKTLTCKIKYHEILKVERKDVASLIRVKGIKRPFKVPRPPVNGALWAGVIYLHGSPWMLYEYCSEQKKNTTRKV
jgi:hypothetical protein